VESLFIHLYHFFHRRKPVFWGVFVLVLGLMAAAASRITFEEDITRFFPDDERVSKLNYIFQNSKLSERLVVMVSMRDSSEAPQPDSLVAYADACITQIEGQLAPYVKAIEGRVDDAQILEVIGVIPGNLPVFLEEKDYRVLDSLTQPDVAARRLNDNYRQLVSPSGTVMKNIIVRDPLGFSFTVMKKLQQLQYDDSFELYDNYILSRDHRHLLFFLQPQFGANQTGKNEAFLTGLHEVMDSVNIRQEHVYLSCFGAVEVAGGNARQLRQDSFLTVGVMIALLAFFLISFFRRKRVALLILIPVVCGALFALSVIYLIQGSVSILALAAGSIILGIAVDYSLHFLVHVRYHNVPMEEVIRDLVRPLTLGSATTVLAFLCLQFVNAAVLRDVGLFAALSLMGAALATLIFLPHFIPRGLFENTRTPAWIERLGHLAWDYSRYAVIVIFILTPVFLYFAGQVKFNTDLSGLNFMKTETQQAQARLESVNRSSLHQVYVVASGKTLEEALQKNERALPVLNQLKADSVVNKYVSVSSFLLSDSLQRVRIARWQAFWTPERRARITEAVHREGAILKFSPQVLANFDSLLTRSYAPVDAATIAPFRKAFFDNYLIEKDGQATVITLANVPPERKPDLYKAMEGASAQPVDRQLLTNLFAEYVHADFNFIVTVTSFIVFIFLLLSYGRIELTIISFVPMLVTWVWILGIMALAGIEFNIVNVMISTFIFGIGDDYSIFTMDGLQQEYKTGREALPAVRTSIVLSALTVISGLGVLVLAKHPALRSIAAISIIGIVCVYIMSQTIEPFLFRWLITERTRRKFTPGTFAGFHRSVYSYVIFIGASLVLTLAGMVLRLIPFGKKKIRLFFHKLIQVQVRLLVYSNRGIRKRIINLNPGTFSRAGIVIANHTSFLDILVIVMLHPKLILLTNRWVWNSAVFGGVVRLADYYPVADGVEDSVDRLRARVEEGYSVVIFPEGTRTGDGKIKRFHKGAFYLAEALQVPIRPLLIHGAVDAIQKGDKLINSSRVTLKFLPDIMPDDMRFGATYTERTKAISRYFREEHRQLSDEVETPAYYRYKLISNYLYKGPVLEWYMRVKVSLEKNYAPFHALVSRRANVLDLGCGYGFLSYMLFFLSEERVVTGVDYDEDKITTANNCYSRTERIEFHCADVTRFPLEGYDTIIIADVLHYLLPQAQEDLLVRCFQALPPGGMLIVRDGDADLKDRHQGTRLTEFFSVKLMKFNKSANTLNFMSGKRLRALAEEHGLTLSVLDETKLTSNVIFVMEKGPLGSP
jgi:1-acyl-sn-glycerol-3-phosphate acyltransferase